MRGPFTIDENNYLVTVLGLRQGRLTVPGTDDLPPSRELLFFDPAAPNRDVLTTPVVSTAPPLYAALALPFALGGWRGLAALNTLALLATIAIVFVHARAFGGGANASWLAAVSVGLCAYFLEYAQGVWPHLVAVALVAGALLLAARALDEGGFGYATGAGLLAAAAAGVRYQNGFVICCIGLGLLLLARHRLRAAAAFTVGALPLLLTSSLINHSRLGSWNPLSKGRGYIPTPSNLGSSSRGFLSDFARMAWARIIDYSAAPSLTGTADASFHTPHPESGAYVMVTAVKKAWLQSAPWLVIGLIVLVLAWLPAKVFVRLLRDVPQRQLRLLSLVVLPTLVLFSAAGPYRTDGLCFNQRYFCELVPPVAIAFAWCVDRAASRRTFVLAGSLAGALLAMAALSPHHLDSARHYAVMYIPLALAVVLAASWGFELSTRSICSEGGSRPSVYASPLLAAMVGLSLSWGMTIHLGDDLQASRILRESRRDYLRQLRPYLSDHAAAFVGNLIKDALGPLQLEQDLVIVVPALDHGTTTKALLEAFLAQGRRVYFQPNVLPFEMLSPILDGRRVRYLGRPPVWIEVAPG